MLKFQDPIRTDGSSEIYTLSDFQVAETVKLGDGDRQQPTRAERI